MRPGDRPPLAFRLQFAADPAAVRAALLQVDQRLRGEALTPEHRATVELVLAEILNNIVEHAFAGLPPGMIQLTLRLGPDRLCGHTTDTGRPFPGGLPRAEAPAQRPQRQALPEGGFGWALIRQLCADLHYSRSRCCNLLSFSIPFVPLPAADSG